MVTDPPVGRLPFQATGRAVSWVPDCDHVALQPWVSRASPRMVPFNTQPVTAPPLLVTVSSAVNPPGQLLARSRTVHVPAGGVVGCGVGDAVGETVGEAVGVGFHGPAAMARS